MTNSFSESRSEKVSKEGRPPKVDVPSDSRDLLNWDSGLIRMESLPKRNLCSSSSPEQSVGKGGKLSATPVKLEVGESTMRLRGSQKSALVFEMADRGTGEGDGESEGQELIERRSDVKLVVTDGGWINTVIVTS